MPDELTKLKFEAIRRMDVETAKSKLCEAMGFLADAKEEIKELNDEIKRMETFG